MTLFTHDSLDPLAAVEPTFKLSVLAERTGHSTRTLQEACRSGQLRARKVTSGPTGSRGIYKVTVRDFRAWDDSLVVPPPVVVPEPVERPARPPAVKADPAPKHGRPPVPARRPRAVTSKPSQRHLTVPEL